VDPLNGRHTPLCTGCGEEFETPADVKKRISEEIKNYKSEMKSLRAEGNDIRGEIASLEDEISSRKIKLTDLGKGYSDIEKELKILEGKVIYGCVEESDRIEQRTAKAQLDVHQETLPFEGVPARA
jgi:chromosome segregation ATPase